MDPVSSVTVVYITSAAVEKKRAQTQTQGQARFGFIDDSNLGPEFASDTFKEIESEMSTPQVRPAERGYHQDYIARIRYENALPPPPGAPKLLNIPTEGLKYYTSAAFSSRLARQQPLNIEADAELGMPIDLVGMPGIFDGDESCESHHQEPLVCRSP